MTCSCSSLYGEATYTVSEGETFQVTVDFADADAGQAQLRTALSGGTLAATFTVTPAADTVLFVCDTAGLAPGVYYFDAFVEVASVFTCVLRRQALHIVPAVTVLV